VESAEEIPFRILHDFVNGKNVSEMKKKLGAASIEIFTNISATFNTLKNAQLN